MNLSSTSDPVEILLVEDNAGDARLAREGLRQCRIPHALHVVDDGVKAMDFLHRHHEYTTAPRPDLILLDLNMPRKDGREVLREIKQDAGLMTIPVVILTTSGANEDVNNTYSLHANCYVTKPLELREFLEVMKSILDFWFSTVSLPSRS